jgi:hypothetical protein
MDIPEIDLKLETVYVETRTRPLPPRKSCITRLPRRVKKMLKKKYGEQGFIDWMNEPMKHVIGEPIFYFIDAEEELTKILIEELKSAENGNKEEIS